jgi:hypothetical protein
LVLAKSGKKLAKPQKEHFSATRTSLVGHQHTATKNDTPLICFSGN